MATCDGFTYLNNLDIYSTQLVNCSGINSIPPYDVETTTSDTTSVTIGWGLLYITCNATLNSTTFADTAISFDIDSPSSTTLGLLEFVTITLDVTIQTTTYDEETGQVVSNTTTNIDGLVIAENSSVSVYNSTNLFANSLPCTPIPSLYTDDQITIGLTPTLLICPYAGDNTWLELSSYITITSTDVAYTGSTTVLSPIVSVG